MASATEQSMALKVMNKILGKQQAAVKEDADRTTFANEYWTKARTLREQPIEREKSKHSKGRAADTKKGPAGGPQKKLPEVIEQAVAKRFIPEEGASIWPSNTRRAWCGHVPPRRRISEPFEANGGEHQALRAIVVRIWQQYLELKGQLLSECPFDISQAISRLPSLPQQSLHRAARARPGDHHL